MSSLSIIKYFVYAVQHTAIASFRLVFVFILLVRCAARITYFRRAAILKPRSPNATEGIVACLPREIAIDTVLLAGLLAGVTVTAGPYHFLTGVIAHASARGQVNDILARERAG